MSVEAALSRYRGDPRVLYIEPNFIVHASVIPNDPQFAQLWGMHNTGQIGGTPGADIHAPGAWDVTAGNDSVLVAIIDTGIFQHADLAQNIWTNPGEIAGNGVDDDGNGFIDDVHGYDFARVALRDPTNDDNGHGTHVSGTVGAVGNNGVGVAGVAWHVKLMAVKFLDQNGSGTLANAISAIEYATRMGARVMNNSWGGGPFSQALYDAIRAAGDAGVVFVVAAGNDGTDNDQIPEYPASYDLPNIIAVAASDSNDQLANFSNFGANSVHLAAPGTHILSTWRTGGYATFSGTSMATPHVTGAVALVLSRFPNMDPASVRRLLMSRVDRIPSMAGRIASGGRLNIARALADPDTVPPDAITDLAVAGTDGQWAELHWTATGDDRLIGQAERYELRYSTTPITPDNFALATLVRGLAAPEPAGDVDHARASGLDFNTTYYFAIVARDEYGNASGISNVVSGVTLAPPSAVLTGPSLDAALLTGATTTRALTINNSGASELVYRLTAQPRAVPAAPAGRMILPAVRRAAPAGDAGASAAPRYDAGAARAFSSRAAPATSRARAAPGTQAAALVGYRVLMLTVGGDVSDMRDQLTAFPDLVQIDVMDLTFGLPSLGQLQNYQAVLLSDATRLPDQFGLGDVLADYADWGGGVILTLASFVTGYEVRGRLASGGYLPLAIGNGPGGSGVLGEFDALHPIMNGVTDLAGNLLGIVVPAPGAQVVASWIGGRPLVATQGAHVVAVNLYFDQPGHWSGDAPLLLHNAIRWAGSAAPFLRLDRDSGLVVPGASDVVNVTLDAARLYGGDYVSDIVMQSNDPVHPLLTLKSTIHVTGAPDIDVFPLSLDFGQRFVGYSEVETLTVVNLGTDPLHVSGVTTSSADLHLAPTAFTLGLGDTMRVLATYAPSVPDSLGASIEIASDDPDEPTRSVAVSGHSLLAPDISVAPASVSADLMSGALGADSIGITNTGGSELLYSVGWRPVLASGASVTLSHAHVPASSAVTRVGVAPEIAASLIPRPAPVTTRTSSASPRTRAAVPSGVPAAPDILVLTTTDVSQSVETALQAMGRNYDLVTTEDFTAIDFSPYRTVVVCMNGGALEEPDCLALANAASAGRLLFMIGGSVNTPFYRGMQQYLLSNTGQQGWAISSFPQLVVVDPADPLARGLPSSLGFNVIAAGFYMLRINDPLAVVAARNGDGQEILVHKPIGAGTLVYYAAAPDSKYWYVPSDYAVLQSIVTNALQFETPRWISASPVTGTLPPGGKQTLEVAFNAAGLNGGLYSAQVVVNSNAPERPAVAVSAQMHVTGIARIALSASSLSFGQRFVSAATSETLSVSNSGTDILRVTAATASPADYSAIGAPFSVPPGESRAIIVTFVPQGVGPVTGSLDIHSNDPDRSVATVVLNGEGLPAPSLAASPSSFAFTAATGAPAVGVLTLQNGGGSTLTYRIGTRALASPATPAAPPTLSKAAPSRGQPARASASRAAVSLAGPLQLAVRRTATQIAGSVLVIRDGGTEADVASVLAGAGYTVTLGPDDEHWNGSNPAPDGFAAVVLLDGPTFGSDMPDSGQAALVRYVSNGGGLIFTEWILYESDQGRYATLRPLIPMSSRSSSSGVSQYVVTRLHPVTNGVSSTFSVESGLTSGHAVSGSELVTLPNGEAVVVAADYALGHIVEFGMAGNWSGYRPLTQPDLQRLLVNAADWVSAGSWLSVSPNSGELSPGASQQIQLTADPGRLLGGDYALDIAIASNDPQHLATAIPATLHVTGLPDIASSAAMLDFGLVQLTATRSETLTVSNRGTERLNVSGVTIDPADYAASGAAFALDPGQSMSLPVTFRPSALGGIAGALEIHSDDPDQPLLTVTLTGTGSTGPDAVIAPSLLEDVLGPAETHTATVRLENHGGAPLTWSAAAFSLSSGAPDTSLAQPSLPSALAMLDERAFYVTSPLPSRFEFTEGDSGSSILEGGAGMFAVGNQISTNLASNLPYSDDRIVNSSQYGLSYFTRKVPGLFVLGADVGAATALRVNGNLGAAGAGAADSAVLSFEFLGHSYVGLVKRVYGAGVPSVNHLIILADPASYSHSVDSDTHFDQDVVSGLVPGTRLYYLLFAGAAGAYVSNDEMSGIMARFINLLAPTPFWVSVSPSDGILPPQGGADLTATFESRLLAVGDYLGGIFLETNQLDHPSLNVPIHVSVVTSSTATDISLVSSSVVTGRVELVWHTSSGPGLLARVQKSSASGGWIEVAPVLADGLGELRFVDADVVPGARYGYRLAIPDASGPRYVAETWVSVPGGAAFALFGLEPNPAVRELQVAFSLPDDQPATLELLDLAGRRVRYRSVGAHGAGRHVLSLGAAGELPSGVYLVRLERAGRRLVTKCVVMR